MGLFNNHLAVRYTFMGLHLAFSTTLLGIVISESIGKEWFDFIALMNHSFVAATIIVYLIPAAILCLLHKESRYERGWMEMLFLTWQTLWLTVAVVLSAYHGLRNERILPLASVNLAVLILWFGWTLYVSAKMARARGHPWSQPLILRRVSMGRIVREHEWHSGEAIGMDKVGDSGSDVEIAKPL